MWANGAKYVGQYVNNKIEGIGQYTNHMNNTYKGQWKNNQKNGNGTFTWNNGALYIGNYLND